MPRPKFGPNRAKSCAWPAFWPNDPRVSQRRFAEDRDPDGVMQTAASQTVRTSARVSAHCRLFVLAVLAALPKHQGAQLALLCGLLLPIFQNDGYGLACRCRRS